MISQQVLKEISDIVGHKHIKTPINGLSEYASDGTKLEFMPDAVVFPASSGEVSKILRLANKKGFPVIPRGAGSGMSGGALPVQGGLVMAMNRLNRIVHIDRDNLVAKVGPGVITAHFQRAVEALGLFYPPDPASAEISTIGGNVAECAGGFKAVKYGVTRDYVIGLTVVLPTGEILKTGVETMKGVAGYDLTRLIIGSEGTLAVITEVILRLVPKPQAKKTMVALFSDVSGALMAVSEIIRNRVTPSVLEFMDRLCLECVQEEISFVFPRRAGAMLIMEVDGSESTVKRETEGIRSLCIQRGCLKFDEASSESKAEQLWAARRELSPSLLKLRPHKISEDIVVPRSRMTELMAYLGELSRKYSLPIPAFGHAGDGNIHVNILFDKSRPVELRKARDIVRALFRRVIDLQGTITGEHGIGITKAPYLEMEIPVAGLQLMERIKKAFDPRGILNPGKIFP